MNIQSFWPGWTAENRIGQGTYGSVYRIRRKSAPEGPPVYSAMKVIRIPVMDSEVENLRGQGMDGSAIHDHFAGAVRVLENDIRHMASMASVPGIVAPEDYYIEELSDQIGWNIYIRMELLESLPAYVTRKGTFTEQEARDMAGDICDVLSFCESRNMVHRNIKPTDIFRDRSGRYKLGDLGIAARMEEICPDAARTGTPAYEAPEVIFGWKTDQSTDIYELGMVLYSYLNKGRKPFYPPYPQPLNKENVQAALNRRLQGEMVPPIPSLDSGLNAVIRKACSYQPSERYRSAAEMKRDLEGSLSRRQTYPAGDGNGQDRNAQYGNTLQENGRYQNNEQENRQAYGQGPDTRYSEKKKSNGLLVGIVIAAAVALVTIGIVVGRISEKQKDKTGVEATEIIAEKPEASSAAAGQSSQNTQAAVPQNTQAAVPENTPTPVTQITQPVVQEDTAVPVSQSGNGGAGAVSALYSDGSEVVYTPASYNPAAPDWSGYDALIGQIRTEQDMAERVVLMHQAEDILMGTGAVVPLYYYNDLYLQRPDVHGIYSNLFGFKFFQFAVSPRDTLRINLASEPAKVDPALNSSVDGGCLDVNMFEGLYTYNEAGQLEPALCDPENPYEVSEDGMIYSFHLREGLKWSDGTPLTARDFEYSWKRASAPETGADYAYMFDCFALNGDTIDVTAVDDYTLAAVLNAPCAYFLDLAAFPAYLPVPQAQVEAAADWQANPGAWASEAGFVTNGAYTMESWSHGVSMVLVKNPNYYRADEVTIGKIELMLSSESAAIYAAYQYGDLDFADTVPVSGFQSLPDMEDFHVIDNLGTYYAAFNVNSPIFRGKTVEQANAMRKAVSLLIDRQYIVDTVGQTGQKAATSYIPEGMADGNGGVFKENTSLYTYPCEESAGYYPVYEEGVDGDAVAEARALLEFAGYEFTEDGVLSDETPIRLTYLTNNGTGHIAVAEAMQQDLNVLGIEMDIETCEWNVFLDERKQGNFDFAREGWLADYNDPINMLEMWTSWSGNNDCQFGKS